MNEVHAESVKKGARKVAQSQKISHLNSWCSPKWADTSHHGDIVTGLKEGFHQAGRLNLGLFPHRNPMKIKKMQTCNSYACRTSVARPKQTSLSLATY